MIALTHKDSTAYRDDFEENFFYIKKLKELKKILGKRLIVLSSIFDFFSDEDGELIQAIKNLANKRGYIFDENVQSKAYGETLGACVDGIAQNLNTQGSFLKKTKIRTELTDGHGIKGENLEQIKKGIKNEHPRLSFD